MNGKAKEFLFTLLNTPSPAGFESEGQRAWMKYVGSYADSIENDAYGNVWATLTGDQCVIIPTTAPGGWLKTVAFGHSIQLLSQENPEQTHKIIHELSSSFRHHPESRAV